MIKNVLIDLDDTLLDFKKSEARAITATMKEYGVVPNEQRIKRYSEINDLYWKKLERKELTREEVLVGRFREFFDELKVSVDAISVRYFYENYMKTCVDFIDGAIELLDELKIENYRVYLVSNGTAVVQDSRIKLAGIAKYFDGIFISQRVGHNKPSPMFFETVFDSIKEFNRDETIILGDSLSSDILGGKGVGIKTCLYNPRKNENGVSDYEIDDLSKFLPLIKGI